MVVLPRNRRLESRVVDWNALVWDADLPGVEARMGKYCGVTRER
jgi:hypothetical protein